MAPPHLRDAAGMRRPTAAALALLALVVLLAACDGSGGGESRATDAAAEPPPSEPAPIPSTVVDAVNAEVPAGVDLRFEAAEWDEEDVAYLRPVGWEADDGADLTFSSEAFSIFTMYRLGKSCDGVCSPGKDWEARQDDLLSPVLDPDRYEIVDDRVLDDPAGRTVVARERVRDEDAGLFEPEVRIMTLRWEQRAPTYFECFVVLDGEEDQVLADAFVAACEAAVPLDFDAVSISIGS